MSSIVARIQGDDPTQSYFIQKNEQNNLKGILWGTAGSLLSGASLTLTLGTAALVAGFAISSIGGLIDDNLSDPELASDFPSMLLFSAAAITVDSFALKFTGYCYGNMIRHFGPEFQIVRAKNQ